MRSAFSDIVSLLVVGEAAVAIYALWESGVVVYVGSAVDPWKRFASHKGASGAYAGRDVSMEVLVWVDALDRDRVERFAVRAGLRWGYPLENIMLRIEGKENEY